MAGMSGVSSCSNDEMACVLKCDETNVQLDMVCQDQDKTYPLFNIEDIYSLDSEVEHPIHVDGPSENTLEGHLPRKERKWIKSGVRARSVSVKT